MQLDTHFTILIYPFVHALAGAERSTCLSRLDGRWLPWCQALADAECARLLDDTYFFLPSIRTLLFPETAQLPAGDPSTHPTHMDRLTSVPASQLAATLNPDGVLRLRYAGEHRDALQPLRLVWERRNAQGAIIDQLDPPAPLCIDWSVKRRGLGGGLQPHGPLEVGMPCGVGAAAARARYAAYKPRLHDPPHIRANNERQAVPFRCRFFRVEAGLRACPGRPDAEQAAWGNHGELPVPIPL